MKKTLSVLAILGVVSLCGFQQASAFSWSSLNPAYWGHCPKCEKKKADCGCKKKVDKDCPCTTGAAAPCKPCTQHPICNPCQTEQPKSQPCDECDRLQQEMQNR